MEQLQTFLMLIFAMAIWHAIADYPMQGDFMARAKNRLTPVAGIPWRTVLLMHGLIHAAGVWLVTGYVSLAIAEVIIHCIVDDLKCRKKISFNTDQFIHLLCKVAYAVMTIRWAGSYHSYLLS